MSSSLENITLDKLKPGDRCQVIRILNKGAIRQRILDMGIHQGCEIEVERVAPLGDPVEFKLKGFHILLRKEEAEGIIVRLTEEPKKCRCRKRKRWGQSPLPS